MTVSLPSHSFDLKEVVLKHIQVVVPSTMIVSVGSVMTEPFIDTNVFPDKSNHQVVERSDLLLFIHIQEVKVSESSQNAQTESKPVLVFALTASEYYLCNDSGSFSKCLVYLEKIDTSAAKVIRGLASAAVQGYLEYISKTVVKSGIPLSLHVFGRAKPQYLFPRSAENPQKNVFSAHGLLSWWMRALDGFPLCESIKAGAIKRSFFIPGESRASSLSRISSSLPPSTRSIDFNSWKWGFPWPLTDKAHQIIPRFEDDIKTKGLSLVESQCSIQEWMDVLEATGEARDDVCGIFIVDVPKQARNDDDTNATLFPEWFQEIRSQHACQVTKAQLDDIFTTWMNLDFSKEEKAIASTAVVLHLYPGQLGTATGINTVTPLSEAKLSLCKTVNVLSASAVKRSASSTSLSGVVHNLQTMVKKKKTR